jgi:hypothetical protein
MRGRPASPEGSSSVLHSMLLGMEPGEQRRVGLVGDLAHEPFVQQRFVTGGAAT